MTLPDFEDLLDRHGGDPDAWPTEQRTEALDLARALAEAAATWQAARDVDAALRASRVIPLGSDDAIVSRAIRHRQERPARPSLTRARWAAAIAATLVLGVLVGSDWPEARSSEGVEMVAAYGFDPGTAFDVE